MFEAGEAQKLYDLMIQHKDSKNDELLWRLARACREVAQLDATAADKKKQLMYDAHEYAKQAVEVNPNNGFAHKVSHDLPDGTNGNYCPQCHT